MQNVVIRVKGRIDEQWGEWFEGLTIEHTDEGDTVISGPVRDQSAAYGLLAKLRDLGLQLETVSISITRDEDIESNS